MENMDAVKYGKYGFSEIYIGKMDAVKYGKYGFSEICMENMDTVNKTRKIQFQWHTKNTDPMKYILASIWAKGNNIHKSVTYKFDG